MSNYIVSYQKVIDQNTTQQLSLPDNAVELITSDGVTYVSIPSEVSIDDVEGYDALGAKVVEVDGDLQQLFAQSSHVQLINKRVKDKIVERYSITDEIELLRNAPSAEFDEYHAYAEQCRQWGYEQKLKLGVINVTK